MTNRYTYTHASLIGADGKYSAFREDVKARIARLVDLEDNSFSEMASVLNARLEELLPEGIAGDYQIQGYNGCPRKMSPLGTVLFGTIFEK